PFWLKPIPFARSRFGPRGWPQRSTAWGMAAGGGRAACTAAEPPQHGGAAASLWPARRARRAAAREADQGKLRAALGRVAVLEAELAALRVAHEAAAAQALALAAQGSAQLPSEALHREVSERLALAVPVLLEVLAGPQRAAADTFSAPRPPPGPLRLAGAGEGEQGSGQAAAAASAHRVDGAQSMPLSGVLQGAGDGAGTAAGEPTQAQAGERWGSGSRAVAGVCPLHRSRRNAGLHCAARRAARISVMRQSSLNRLQRSAKAGRVHLGGQARHGRVRGAGVRARAALPLPRSAGAASHVRQRSEERRPPLRGGAPAPPRRQPEARAACEAAPSDWTVARAYRGRSAPPGAIFALAERARRAPEARPLPLASGPRWWKWSVEDSDVVGVGGASHGTHFDSKEAQKAPVAAAPMGLDKHRPESSGGFGEHPAPRPSEGGAGHPHRLPDPGAACSTACTSSPAAFADPSIVTAYLLANEAAVLSGGSEMAAGDIDGERSMQVDGSRNQDGNSALASDAVAHGGFDLSPHFGTDDGVEAAGPQRNGGRSLDDDALLTSPPSGSCSCSGGGGIDVEDGEGGVGGGCTLHGSETVARQEPARGPKRLLALRRHVFEGTVALTVDRDIRRPGWQGDGGDDAPPAPSASELEAGRLWLRDTFGPGSPWGAWARQERQRRREAQLQQ
ncbi:unnamed protein product, partial [Prorocentrum cordatum]